MTKPTKLFLRVEDKLYRGPYWYGPGFAALHGRDPDYDHHPAPWMDKLPDDHRKYFGFASLDQFNSWFGEPHVLDKLAARGFRLNGYYSDEYHLGGKQAMFERNGEPEFSWPLVASNNPTENPLHVD